MRIFIQVTRVLQYVFFFTKNGNCQCLLYTKKTFNFEYTNIIFILHIAKIETQRCGWGREVVKIYINAHQNVYKPYIKLLPSMSTSLCSPARCLAMWLDSLISLRSLVCSAPLKNQDLALSPTYSFFSPASSHVLQVVL